MLDQVEWNISRKVPTRWAIETSIERLEKEKKIGPAAGYKAEREKFSTTCSFFRR